MENIIMQLYDEKNIDTFIANSSKLSNDEISQLISKGNKNTWKNTIKVFEILGFDRWKNAIPDMLELLKDLNWPGTLEASALLAKININEYKTELNSTVRKAVEGDDADWLEHLIWFIINNYVLDLLDIDVKDRCKEIIIQQAKF